MGGINIPKFKDEDDIYEQQLFTLSEVQPDLPQSHEASLMSRSPSPRCHDPGTAPLALLPTRLLIPHLLTHSVGAPRSIFDELVDDDQAVVAELQAGCWQPHAEHLEYLAAAPSWSVARSLGNFRHFLPMLYFWRRDERTNERTEGGRREERGNDEITSLAADVRAAVHSFSVVPCMFVWSGLVVYSDG